MIWYTFSETLHPLDSGGHNEGLQWLAQIVLLDVAVLAKPEKASRAIISPKWVATLVAILRQDVTGGGPH